MKAQHRHELKKNELADVLGHLPEWASRNRNSIIIVTAAIVVAVGIYVWKVDIHDAGIIQERITLTNAIDQVNQKKAEAAAGLSQGADKSFALIPPADDLATLAEAESKPNMAAFALIKRGEAIRSELQFRMDNVTSDILQTQIGLARAAYEKALERQPTLTTLIGAAKLGLGLCAEELGDFAQAKQLYQEIVDDPTLEGVPARTSAQQRLGMMDDFKQALTFKHAPIPAKIQVPDANTPDLPDISKLLLDSNQPSTPIVTIKPEDPNLLAVPPVVDTNIPAVVPAPVEVNEAVVEPADVNVVVPAVEPVVVPEEVNEPAPAAELNDAAAAVTEPNQSPAR